MIKSRRVVTSGIVAGVLALGSSMAAVSARAEVEIEYWQYFFEARVTAMDTLIKNFEAANPGITVKTNQFPYAHSITVHFYFLSFDEWNCMAFRKLCAGIPGIAIVVVCDSKADSLCNSLLSRCDNIDETILLPLISVDGRGGFINDSSTIQERAGG